MPSFRLSLFGADLIGPLALAVLALALTLGCQSAPQAPATRPAERGVSHRTRHLALRLSPGQDLLAELQRAVETYELSAAAVVTCVGSLTSVNLRYANQEQATHLEGHFEIVSLVGTLEPGGGHLHLSISDGTGQTRGGHLLPGSAVYTTAEIVLVALDELRFTRQPDPITTYHELAVEPR